MKIRRPRRHNHPAFLMIALFALLLLAPVLEGRSFAALVLSGMFTLVLVSSVLGVMQRRWMIVAVFASGVPWVTMCWLAAWMGPSKPAALARLGLQTAFLGLLLHTWFNEIFRARFVTGGTICRAVSAYLMLGLMWAAMYEGLTIVDPQAFNSAAPMREWMQFAYFSFTTLTTVGYGDIVPVNSMARSLAMLEAIIGPLYLAVLLAYLVGRFRMEAEAERPAR